MPKSFESIKKQLSTQYYFMNDAWLKDCLNYFLTEHPEADEADILSLVIHQWLLSDLREINNERGCLPKNINQQKVMTLPGNYILQIEKGYDISISKYKQLEKIRNVSNVNIEVTDAEKYQPTESSGKRMMNFFLCDGVQEVTAMEYKPISTFGKIVAGYKIMIKGPVICRRGVILLEEKNISMIGGEIENLLIENATENVLARALNFPENPDPDIYIMKGNDTSQELSDDNMDIDFEAVANIEKLNNTMKTLSASHSSVNAPNEISMAPKNKCYSIILDELPVCFEQGASDIIEVVDDTDDELIGMIDEDNLDVVVAAPTPMHIPDSNRMEQEHMSDLEFCEFEVDDLAEYGNSSANKNTHSSKSQYVQKSALNISKFISDKSTIEPSTAIKACRSNALLASNAKVKTSMQSPLKSRPSSSAQSSRTKQSLKSTVTNSKITDFMKTCDSKKKQLVTPARDYDSVCDVKKIIPTKRVVYKTIKATTKTLQKLTKKDTSWYLEGSVTDGTDDIDVTFSAEVLEKLIGLSFNEFSQRKKMQKTDPKMKDKLRQILRNTESVLIRMDALLKLELVPNETKAKIICITESQEQKMQP